MEEIEQVQKFELIETANFSNEIILDDKKYQDTIKFDNEFGDLFNLGDLDLVVEKMTYAVLGELRDKMYINDSKEHISRFTFSELAYLSGVTQEVKGRIYGKADTKFIKSVDKFANNLNAVYYQKPYYNDERDYMSKSYTKIPLFARLHMIYEENCIEVKLSEEVIQEEMIDEKGRMIRSEKRVYDLFNSVDWSKTPYLELGRKFHNSLRSKYSTRLYHLFAKFRSTGVVYCKAEYLEDEILKLNSSSLRKKKLSIIDNAIEELREIRNDDGNKVFEFINVDRKKRGRTVTNYTFTFSKFKLDLPRYALAEIDENTDEDTRNRIEQQQRKAEFTRIMNKFNLVFSDPITKINEFKNPQNENVLKGFFKVMDADVIIEALDKAGVANKGFGYAVSILKNWKDVQHIVTFEDLQKYNAEYWASQSSTQKSLEEYRDGLGGEERPRDIALILSQIDEVQKRLKNDDSLSSFDRGELEKTKDFLLQELLNLDKAKEDEKEADALAKDLTEELAKKWGYRDNEPE